MAGERNYSIGFKNRAQVTLYEAELKGQISDGAWENATPNDHWHIPCEATAFVAESPTQLGTNFNPIRYYDFARKDLLDVVELRMLKFVKVYTLFWEKDPDYKHHWDLEVLGSVHDVDILFSRAGTDDYYTKKLERLYVLLGFQTKDEFVEAVARVTNVAYSPQDLRKDLQEMKKIMHLRQAGTFGHDITQSEVRFWKNASSVSAPSASKNKRPYVDKVAELIKAARYKKDEIIRLVLAEFSDVKESSFRTFLTDCQNPRYNKYPDLVVIGHDGIFRFSTHPVPGRFYS